jgi:A/G-specific adenine glycosylase
MQELPFDVEALKNWFKQVKRDLPWRNNPTPYQVWVSEIMLQQTQVNVVKGYYERWMMRFPDIETLANASLEEVIKMWEGLGYYTRARNLHAAAQFLVDNYHGTLPGSKEELAEVKGLGPYTIGAILSFAFHQKAAAVDGNVTRVLARHFAIREDVQRSAVSRKIWEIAEEVLPNFEPWVIVEALIELGSTICNRNPKCDSCPIKTSCRAFQLGLQQELPKKGKKVEITSLARNVFVIVHQKQLLLKKVEAGKVMAGLYEFPYIEYSKKTELPFAFVAKKITDLNQVEHSFTRYKVKLHPSLWKAKEAAEVINHEWIPWQEVHHYPFSSGHKKILKELEHAYFTY